MSKKAINLAFINAINNLPNNIYTVIEGTGAYTPVAGVPYQELYYLPAINDSLHIDNSSYFDRGVYQATLKYPNKQGLSKILDKCDLYVNAFAKGTSFTFQGITIAITETPTIVNLGNESDRVVYVVSINYKAYVNLL